jgi:hypothetical protein
VNNLFIAIVRTACPKLKAIVMIVGSGATATSDVELDRQCHPVDEWR